MREGRRMEGRVKGNIVNTARGGGIKLTVAQSSDTANIKHYCIKNIIYRKILNRNALQKTVRFKNARKFIYTRKIFVMPITNMLFTTTHHHKHVP